MNGFLKMASARYSVRKYKGTPVEQEKIDAILEAAKLAPTAKNSQPQKIYVINSADGIARLAEVCSTFSAPLVFAVGYDRSKAAGGIIRPGHCFGETDSTIVCTHMMFEAFEQGLGSCWIGRFEEKALKSALKIPEEAVICHLLAVGYPADDAVPSEKHTTYRALDEMVEYL